MRIHNISPEYLYSNVNGTLSMLEKKSFLGSKLLKFDNNIDIKSENIVYYQTLTNEQLNLNIEKTLDPIIYDTVSDKSSNSFLTIDDSQTLDQQYNNTRWNLKINVKTILINYLFATLKKYRTFENVKNNMVISNDVNAALKDYIIKNLLDRYKFDHIDLYISYNDLLNGGLRYGNTYDKKIELPVNLNNTYNRRMDINDLELEVTFNQSKPSSDYSFNYYYNLYFIKI
jgi:hypothetical protein